MSKAVARQIYYYMGRQIIFQDWQYIVIVISKKLTYKQGLAKADFKDTRAGNDKEYYKVPDNLATSYTSEIVTNYSITINIFKYLITNSLKIFGQISYW